MMKKYLVILLLIALQPFALAQGRRGGTSNDPFVLNENARPDQPLNDYGNFITAGKTCRTDAGGILCQPTINPAQKTLALIVLGASNGASVGPSAYVPSNTTVIDNLNIYNGALYVASDPLLGQSMSTLGPGSVSLILADGLIGIFNRVILVNAAIGGSTSIMLGIGGVHYERGCVAMRRLAAAGITAATTGVTIGLLFMTGENDTGTSAANYQAAIQQQVAHIQSCGFSGRIFIPTETFLGGAVNATIQTAQANLVALGNPWFAGGNLDSLGTGSRQADQTHFTNAGQISAEGLILNAMIATGAPY